MKEAKRCLATLRRVLGDDLCREMLATSRADLTRLPLESRGRQLIGWLWVLVVLQPIDLRHLATFGRFMRPGDGRLPEGLEDWSI